MTSFVGEFITRVITGTLLAVCFGGRVAEEVIFGKDNISTGAGGGSGSDINQAHNFSFLKEELVLLSKEFSIIGEVRGQGLFLGIELVDKNINPLAKQATYLINRMKDHGILMSIDGPDLNVLKIKPPLVFNKEHANELIHYLKRIFKEDFMQSVPR